MPRKKTWVHFTNTYRIELDTETEARLLACAPKGLNVQTPRNPVELELVKVSRPKVVPIVVGTGPAGLFAAWYMARCGLCPMVIERGAPVDERKYDVHNFFETGSLNSESEYCLW